MIGDGGSRGAGDAAGGQTRAWWLAGSLLLCAVIYLGDLGSYPLQDPDEGRYAEIPREMLESGDWLTPRLNYVAYFEKPPLVYWLVALSFEALGVGEGSARLISALAGLLVVFLTFRMGASFYGPRAGWLAAAALATSPLFYALSQAITPDMLLTATLTTTLYAVHRAREPAHRTRWVFVAVTACALSVLTKGMVGLALPGWIALAFLLVERDFVTIRAFLRISPIATFLVLSVPWFAWMAAAHPDFLSFFFVREHLGRFLGEAGHPARAFYYVPVIFLGALPWTLCALALGLRRTGRRAARGLRGDGTPFALIWGLSIVVFFELAGSKLGTYVLPAFPAFALLLGAWFDRALEDPELSESMAGGIARTFLGVGIVCLVAALLSWPLASEITGRVPIAGSGLAGVRSAVAGMGFVLVGSGLVTLFGRLGARERVAVCMVGFGLALFVALGGRGVVKSSAEVARVVRDQARPGELVVLYAKLWQGLPFYLERRVGMIKHFDEVTHGVELEPGAERHYWRTLDPLVARWASGERVFVLTNAELVEELAEKLQPAPVLVGRDGRRAVFSNRAGPVRQPAD